VIQAGAADFIPKPASPERLLVSMGNALKMNAMTGQVSRLSRQVEGRMRFDDLITGGGAMTMALDLARRAASSNIPISIEGESGVDKEMVARALQGSSERAGRPFVAVNCGAIQENLVEIMLFAHEKGAFTGATNRELQQQVSEGKFREDLFYRLNVFPIQIPPLRDRLENIPPLSAHFVAKLAATDGKAVRGLSGDALELLMGFDWSGNVRQLENVIFRAVVFCDGDELTLEGFPQIAQSMGMASPMAHNGGANGGLPVLNAAGDIRTLNAMEADMIRLAIDKYEGHMTKVGRRLGISRSTLYCKVSEFGIDAGR
jgi:DNA-binding NtrC family response regulator